MRIRLLGTGTPTPSLKRMSSGYLVEVGERKILFDFGPGAYHRLLESGVKPTQVTDIFFTHLHYDHCLDYIRLLMTRWDQGADKIPELNVYGPAHTARMTELVVGEGGVFGPDLAARTELPMSQAVFVARGGTLPRSKPRPVVREIAADDVVDCGPFSVRARAVIHAQPILDSRLRGNDESRRICDSPHEPGQRAGCSKSKPGSTVRYSHFRTAEGDVAMAAKTMFEKIWASHLIAAEEGEALLYVDRLYVHEGSSHAFAALDASNRKLARPRQVFAHADHYVPTASRAGGVDAIAIPEIRNMVKLLAANTARHGVTLFGIDDPRQGILHVVPPEQGITQPGLLIVGADSHTSTHGAFGALAFGAGASDVKHVMATQRTWQRKSATLCISVGGALGPGVSAKDVILAIIAKIGVFGGAGHVIEYAGSAITGLTMEGRMTLCNMSIEAGARAGMVAPDEVTYAYMEGRPYAPRSGSGWAQALAFWRSLPSDAGAAFDREVALDGAAIAPMVTWGTNPEQATPVTGQIPDMRNLDVELRSEYEAALDYMGLQPGMPLQDIAIDRVFIGSCTNSRIEDLRAAAAVARLGRAVIPAWVVPGSGTVKAQAEKEGLDAVFRAAGFEWREPGCSLCTALNGDQLKPGERCASTSNRNFRGRQGIGGRTHLLSPAMAAAAALKGRLTDVRELLQ
ncbi:MAG: 3-isopropylmalate dehydratase large subunit [Betaproteobacteria bacterium]|nr:3-isopropylmalate dehydratase large subunit [Betaproteobacteria bacterium]